ncbi:MAG: CvpA family protein, partial [Dysgonamonadaceae bacterium]|nr:CvpA family protein [Dysgonamonadaceae bacterium]
MSVFDWIIIVCLAAGLIKGLRDGFIKQLVSFIALILAIVFAGQLSLPVRTFIMQHMTGATLSPQIISALCYILAFVGIMIIISLLGKIIDVAIKLTP